MGGISFIISDVLAIAAATVYLQLSGGGLSSQAVGRMVLGIAMALGFGMVGFADDYAKAVKKQSEGLTPSQKLILQTLIALAYLMGYAALGGSTYFALPFVGGIDLKFLFYPVALFIIVGTVNAVNLTDGIDGLSSSVTVVACIGMLTVSTLLHVTGVSLMAAAKAGGCLGFLIYNFHPAKMFMGDTGSLYMGGMITAMAFGCGMPFLLVLVGVVYLMETLSDIIQIGYYKKTHKRIFKMAPIHHHFELCGWNEYKIVAVFSAVGAIGSLLAVLWVVSL